MGVCNSTISVTCSSREEVTQSKQKHDTVRHSEAPSLNTLRVVSVSRVASHVSNMVTVSARINANCSIGRGWQPVQ